MSLHIDGQQVWIFIPKQLAMIFICLPQPFILKQDDFVKLHSNGPDSILNVSGAPKTRITKLGDMVISSISVSTHVVKSLTIRQPSSNWAELDKLWEGSYCQGWTAHGMIWFKKVIC